MDEGDGLENRYMGNCIVGSNPTPSAKIEAEQRPLGVSRGLCYVANVHELLELGGLGIPFEEVGHRSRQLILHVRQHVGVQVQGDANTGVT